MFDCIVLLCLRRFLTHSFSTTHADVQMVKGAKNVVFGGEGLFMTTLKGPGTVWLQGMPPDRMISEIARRVPGGGLGLGIPIGMGGGGGEGEADVGGEGGEGGEEVAGAGGVEEQVAATDAAIDADRQATVASSGGGEGVDPDSPEALFGDAAAPESAASNTTNATTSDSLSPQQDDDMFASQADESSWNDDAMQQGQGNETTFTDEGFGEESFSTEDSFPEDSFGDDTSFSTFDEESSSSMADAASDAVSEEGGSGIGDVLSTIWDLFMGGGDD